MGAKRDDRQAEAELLVAEAVGRLIEFWGFRAVLGRIWAILYLSEKPLSASELCDRLSISTGAASMSLAELERWGVVLRHRPPGERKDFFEAETDIWKMVSRVYRERELVQIERALESFAQAAELFDLSAKIGDAQGRRAGRFGRERTANLVELAKLGRSLIGGLVERGRVDFTPLLSWTRRPK
ncbi:GbsR/MarR family transcriptional regulator [Vulgatibacter sp.]|uniref:GbsR/MarR family transcriptional regulator n=1 Tax=Vulgatibacter sp. TaxID=1971226 RepID=UPI003564C36D